MDYYLFTYAESPESALPLGVLIHDGQIALVRAVGLADNWDIDLTQFKAISGRAAAMAWIYEAWLVTFKEVEGETRNDRPRFEQIMSELGENPVGFSVEKDGSIELPEGGTPEGAVDHLYREICVFR